MGQSGVSGSSTKLLRIHTPINIVCAVSVGVHSLIYLTRLDRLTPGFDINIRRQTRLWVTLALEVYWLADAVK